MSAFEIIKKIDKNNPTLKQKIVASKNLIKYYLRLERGILNKTIFESGEFDVAELKKLQIILKDIDTKNIEVFLTKNIKEFLKNFKLKKKINFTERQDFLQVGANTVFIHEPFEGLWTTGKATFYFPISRDSDTLSLEIFSIIPNTIIIGQDTEELGKISVNKIQTKSINLPLKSTGNKIVEIFVDIEKRWRPNVITNKSNEIPMGINIKSLKVN